jgi:hypothetical protein
MHFFEGKVGWKLREAVGVSKGEAPQSLRKQIELPLLLALVNGYPDIQKNS